MELKISKNDFTGLVQVSNENGTLCFRSNVKTEIELPLNKNNFNDARFSEDNGHLFIWNNSSWIDMGANVIGQIHFDKFDNSLKMFLISIV